MLQYCHQMHGVFSLSNHPTFIFLPAEINAQGFTLNYQLDQTHFSEQYQIEGLPADFAQRMQSDGLQKLLAYLSLAAGVSYFKLAPFSQIKTELLALDTVESQFFNKLYVNGLAEFAYRNELDLTQACQFPVGKADASPATPTLAPLQAKALNKEQAQALVLIGGGKDSLVSIQKLKTAGYKQRLFAVNPAQPIADCVKAADLPYTFVRRKLDPELFKLNEAGALNGHVPITAIISFVAAIVAQLVGCDAVITSNEASANEATLMVNGRAVNHQYSKSIEFEADFKALSDSHLASSVAYFSLLRPYSEFAIVSQFIKSTEYDAVFTSCNRAFKIYQQKSKTRWCLACPKCHFVYLMFAAQDIPKSRLLAIFSGDPLADINYLDSFASLVGLTQHKPWECVGEKLESAACIYLLSQKTEFKNSPIVMALLPKLLEHYGQSQLQNAVTQLKKLHPHWVPALYMEALNA